MSASAQPLAVSALRERIAAIGADGSARGFTPSRQLVSLGVDAVDQALGGGLRRGGLHEIRSAEPGSTAPASGFALALAARLTAADGTSAPWLWVRQDFSGLEAGEPYGPGLAAFGLDPARLVLVGAADASDVLRAAEEGLRCAALGAVLIEPWGDPRVLDLTASRRLVLAAEASGVAALLLRPGAREGPGGSATRWSVGPAPSAALPARGVGPPAFQVVLSRSRQSGLDASTLSRPATAGHLPDAPPVHAREGDGWTMEWRPNERIFADPLRREARNADPEPVRAFPGGAFSAASGGSPAENAGSHGFARRAPADAPKRGGIRRAG